MSHSAMTTSLMLKVTWSTGFDHYRSNARCYQNSCIPDLHKSHARAVSESSFFFFLDNPLDSHVRYDLCIAPKIPYNFYNNFSIYSGYELSQTWAFPGELINCEK